MPKPKFGINGSGMHVNMSLCKDGKNIFDDPDGELGLSKEAYWFIGGLMKHMKGMSAITNPLVNSYKRLVPGFEAPVYIAWSTTNRSPLIRIPATADGEGTRIELRSPDPMANPYLVNAVTLAAGLDGIERKLELPPEATAETLKLTDRQMVEAGYTPLPRSLKEALDVFEDSQFMKDALGEHIHSFFLKKKRDEWHKFESTITEWEIKHYLANS